jgi:hypothetical protein
MNWKSKPQTTLTRDMKITPKSRRTPPSNDAAWSRPAAFRVLQHVVMLVALACASRPANAAVAADTIGQKFATPETAIAALRTASAAMDTNALRTLFGADVDELENPDRVQATNDLKTFNAAFAATNHLVKVSDDKLILEVGNDAYPFAVPLVKSGGGWYFDTAAGKDELLSRRIGKNELGTLRILRAYVEAQREYASVDRDGDQVLEYAQKLMSSPGKHDGLYWPPDFDGDESPLGPLIALAQGKGYSVESKEEGEEPAPLQGYYFKILTRQGKYAPGGKYDYIINGNMIGGFAMVAWPAGYGDTGIMTFIVNQQGIVYQKDLGPGTAKAVKKMTEYNPDPSWHVSRD